MDARLTAEGIACRRGERLLLRGIALACGPGDGLHLAGANGIGKSTLIRTLGGLLRPIAGTVRREGAAALLDDRPALDAALPLGRALTFWARLDGTQPALDALGLAPLAEVPVRYLSTGQTKRAMLARVIVQAAPIWLLDEPLSGLDTAGRALVAELVAAHRRAGGIAIVASHQSLDGDFATLDLHGFQP